MTAQPLYAVKRTQSLRLQAMEQIRQAIVTGAMAPGSLHSEQTIANDLGISRTPVREALLQLEREGLVEFVPHRGARIAQFDPQHLTQVFEMRAALEGFCAAKIASGHDQAIIDKLDSEIQRQKEIIEKDDHLAWVIANMDFHTSIVAGANNPLLDSTMPSLSSHTMRIGYRMIARRERMDESYDEHRAIVDAIRRRNPEQARLLAVKHMQITESLMNRLFEQLGIDLGDAPASS